MAPDFQSSFIPKEPVTSEEVFKKKKAGFSGILAVSFFVATLVVTGALYAYKNILQNEVENTKAELASAEKTIDRKTINQMEAFSKKLGTVKSILAKHQAISGFLENLASSTVTTLSFTDFDYTTSQREGLMVKMSGKTGSYANVALQEQVFSQNNYFKSVSFSGLNLDSEGKVSFDVSFVVDPKVEEYNPDLSGS